MNKMKIIISWILRILMSVAFLLAGFGKLSNSVAVQGQFSDWGFPQGFHLLIGVLEMGLALLLIYPKTLKYGLLGLGVIMIGAFFTHLINDPFLQVLRPLIFLSFLIVIYVLTRSNEAPVRQKE